MKFELMFSAEPDATSPQQIKLRVLESPVGEAAEGVLEMPEEVSSRLPWRRQQSREPTEEPTQESPRGSRAAIPRRHARQDSSQEDVERSLGAACFRGAVRDRWLGSRAVAERVQRPLRLMLRFDERCERLGLCSWPWERLRDPEGLPLALSRSTPLSRWIESAHGARDAIRNEPTRILLASASPLDRDPLGVEREARALERSLGSHPSYDLRRAENVDSESLRSAVVDHRPHVLHFIGHGSFDASGARLVVEDGAGGSEMLDPERLATVLGDQRDLRLIVLACCHSADSADTRDAGTSFTGLARALVAVGVPQVVAFRGPIEDRAAWQFARSFYHRLACGDPVELAMVEGRHAVRNADEDWSKPILFQRVDDGRIQGDTPPSPTPDAWRINARGGLILTLGTISFLALATAAYLAVWDSPPLRDAWRASAAAFAAVAAAASTWLHRQGPGALTYWTWRWHDRRHLAAALLLALVSSGAVVHQSLRAACLERCGLLGCGGPALDVSVVGPTALASRVRAALASVEGVRVLGELEPSLASCVDFRLSLDGEPSSRVHGELARPDGSLVGTTSIDVAVDGDLGAVDRMARWMLGAVGRSVPADLSMTASDPRLEELVRLGHLDLARGDAARAGRRFAAALATDSGFAPAYQGLGLSRLAEGSAFDAVEPLREAVTRAPGVAVFWHSLGLALEDDGSDREALQAYGRAVELDPFDARARNEFGRLSLDVGDASAAAKHLGVALGLSQDDSVEAVVRKNLGRLRLAEGRADEALQQLEAARKLADPYPEATRWRAVVMERVDSDRACVAWADLLDESLDAAYRMEAERRRIALGCRP